jgi:hypothetical protein
MPCQTTTTNNILMNQPNDNNSTERDAVIKELKMLVEVNRRLARELIDVRLELEQLKLKVSREH